MTDDLQDDPNGVEVDLTSLLETVINMAAEQMTGPMLAKVNSYDSTRNRASVTPLVPMVVDGDLVTPPTLPAVPVQWYGTSDAMVRMPLLPGAIVELAPLGHDHSRWITAGTANQRPDSDRRFALSDLVARPLMTTPYNAAPAALSYSTTAAVLYGAWLVGGADAVKAVALHQDNCPAAALMATWMTQVETAINILAGGSVAPLSTTFSTVGIATVTASATALKAK